MPTGFKQEWTNASWGQKALRLPMLVGQAAAARLLPLLALMPLASGCLVVPIPTNRYEPAVRTNITPDTVQLVGMGDVSRTEVLLRLGEPDEVSPEERQFRFHTERVKWDVYWAVGGGYSAAVGHATIKGYYDLVLRFDDQGKLIKASWLAGSAPDHLRPKAQWEPTAVPASDRPTVPETPHFAP